MKLRLAAADPPVLDSGLSYIQVRVRFKPVRCKSQKTFLATLRHNLYLISLLLTTAFIVLLCHLNHRPRASESLAAEDGDLL